MHYFILLLIFCVSLFSYDFPDWMQAQVRRDFEKVSQWDLHPANLDFLLWSCQERGLKGFIRYQIHNRHIAFFTFWPEDHPRVKMMNQAIQRVVTYSDLPTIDFIVCLEDAMDGANLPAPFFVFAKNATLEEKLLLIPDFEVLETSDALLSEVLQGSVKYPWKEKEAKAFWRGSATGGVFNEDTFLSLPRSELVTRSFRHSHLLDARLTLPLAQSDDPEKVQALYPSYFAKGQTPIGEHLKYKYQILVDGNTCAYSRAYWQFFSGCPIFKQASPNIQWYYKALMPWTHYIPCNSDFSDLPELLHWAKKHDRDAHRIGKNAQEFARSYLKKEDIYQYLYLALSEYAKIQQLQVR